MLKLLSHIHTERGRKILINHRGHLHEGPSIYKTFDSPEGGSLEKCASGKFQAARLLDFCNEGAVVGSVEHCKKRLMTYKVCQAVWSKEEVAKTCHDQCVVGVPVFLCDMRV